ncbi:MAG: hypothetical protein KGJ79_05725 [Alphaproteobacteria bacterium]|nr:hypothetical protein [Alphaproteobacteria bacterium]MDE2110620.1 hypothetical protein [Alphaproteobacteria bacterium]MDE2495049.1 hypothetical protein [Alphaproteobacteria bacterium]
MGITKTSAQVGVFLEIFWKIDLRWPPTGTAHGLAQKAVIVDFALKLAVAFVVSGLMRGTEVFTAMPACVFPDRFVPVSYSLGVLCSVAAGMCVAAWTAQWRTI